MRQRLTARTRGHAAGAAVRLVAERGATDIPVTDVQISSGTFPRCNRNLDTGEPRATATTLRVADQQVLHTPAHPSAVMLPLGGPN
ncbi:hypothetical protein [Streptomyces sp. NPDC101455]|uniref:hypothetical protein n=1 Tax=Streptomyces sp. NPDC101455 TaxID=3366142 RepID=UPI0037FBCADF